MRIFSLPEPPNPEAEMYKNSPALYNKALYTWACSFKSQMQSKNRANDRAAAQNFVVSNYATSSTLTGTDTSTNVASVVCTLIQALIDKGLLKSNIIDQ